MYCLKYLSRIATVLAFTASSAVALAGSIDNVRDGREPAPDANGHIPQKIIHQVSPQPDTGALASPFGHGSSAPPVGNLQPPTGNTGPNTTYPISSHGGAVMPSVSQIVVIWYGSWGSSTGTNSSAGQQIIRDALYGFAVDGYNNTTVATIIDANGSTVVAGNYVYSGITSPIGTSNSSVFSSYYGATTASTANAISSSVITECTQQTSTAYGGMTLSDSSVLALVKAAASGSLACSALPGRDGNAIYLVLSSSDIAESSGFLTRYCGWHSYTTINSTPVKYGFIGNPAKKLSSCSYQTASSPNGNPGVDAMVSVIAHELEETVSDPQLNAWYNAQGSENGDMCAWTFGSSQKQLSSTNALISGSYYNVVLPTKAGAVRPYLLQRALARGNSACYINASGAQQ
jgi:Phosphate-induced protein 1 conserved region